MIRELNLSKTASKSSLNRWYSSPKPSYSVFESITAKIVLIIDRLGTPLNWINKSGVEKTLALYSKL